MEYTITFSTPHDAEHKIIIKLDDGTTKEYLQSDKEQYIADYPSRVADVVAMGWNIEPEVQE